jgi:NTP pyrophosphatase (non-canonical NTP hydrolase)
LKSRQEEVEEFMDKHDMEGTVEFRIMDLVSEVGEVVKDATKSADYGMNKEDLDVKEDEIGDVLFSLLAVCNDLDIDADSALQTALDKYQDRIDEKGDPGSR